MWAVKGQFQTALEDDEDTHWVLRDGQEILEILVVSSIIWFLHVLEINSLQQTDSADIHNSSRGISLPLSVATEPPNSGATTRAPTPASVLPRVDAVNASPNLLKESIMTKLGIPLHFANREDWGLQLSYAKWKAYLNATNTYTNMRKDGTWSGPSLTGKDLIELFVSKSHFHSHFKKAFGKVHDYPEMVEWLGGEGDTANPSYNTQVWGFDKVNYTFADLFAWLEKAEGAHKGKGKKKDSKGKKKDDDEGSSKKKDKDSNGKKGKKDNKKKKQVN